MGKFDSYITGWRRRQARQNDEQKKRSEELLQIAFRCADYLVRHFDVQRVYLFGSLAMEASTHAKSDIDLAVEGLPAQFYFRALAALWELLPKGIELDLVPIEDAYPSLQQEIKTNGKIIYECKEDSIAKSRNQS